MDPVILELVRESLIAVVNEMRANMIHASYSSVIFEGHDFSCALMTADGRQVAQGLADHPIHIFAVPASTSEILKQFAGDINPGDVFLHNDPYTGGTHLNDVLMLYPIFDADRLVMFAAVRAHWNDIGGMTPGSLSGRVTEILQEGIRIPPLKIFERGVANRAAMALLFSNVRVVSERRGDFNCMLGTSRKAEEHVRRLCARFGEELTAATVELIRRAAERMRSRILELPDGTFFAEGFIETDGHSLEPLPIRVALTVAGDHITVDFSGTAPQVAGPVNAGVAMAANSVFTIVKAFLDPTTPINHGSFEPIEVIAPSGTIANARFPAPCGGMAEIKFAIDSVIAGALSQAAPDCWFGDVKGTANHVHITCQSGNEPRILYEWPAAGTGATCSNDGNNVLRTFAEGDFNSIHSVEVIESGYPLRVRQSSVHAGSCGDGQYRGGCGLLREIEVRAEKAQLSVLSDRNLIPPYGVNGGRAGAPNRFTVLRDGEELEPSVIPGKVSGFPLRRGDIVRVQTSGGGGWGDPLERDPRLVAEDVRQGLLTREQAAERFGVVLDAGGAIDAALTAARKEKLRAQRRQLPLYLSPRNDGSSRRQIALNPRTARALELEAGDLVELVRLNSPTLRAWVVEDQAVPDSVVGIAPHGVAILHAHERDLVEVRLLQKSRIFAGPR